MRIEILREVEGPRDNSDQENSADESVAANESGLQVTSPGYFFDQSGKKIPERNYSREPEKSALRGRIKYGRTMDDPKHYGAQVGCQGPNVCDCRRNQERDRQAFGGGMRSMARIIFPAVLPTAKMTKTSSEKSSMRRPSRRIQAQCGHREYGKIPSRSVANTIVGTNARKRSRPSSRRTTWCGGARLPTRTRQKLTMAADGLEAWRGPS